MLTLPPTIESHKFIRQAALAFDSLETLCAVGDVVLCKDDFTQRDVLG